MPIPFHKHKSYAAFLVQKTHGPKHRIKKIHGTIMRSSNSPQINIIQWNYKLYTIPVAPSTCIFLKNVRLEP